MTAHIITGPHTYDSSVFEPFLDEDLVIGADQGARYLIDNNLRCDLAIGDFDSVTKADKERILSTTKEHLTHPIKKNFTDTYLALQEALKRGYEDIFIYGGIGERFDHSYANMQLLQLGNITIKTTHETMYVLDPGTYHIHNEHKYISFFALEDVSGLRLEDFEYELDSIFLSIDDPLCISNHGSGTVHFEQGTLLVIHQNEY